MRRIVVVTAAVAAVVLIGAACEDSPRAGTVDPPTEPTKATTPTATMTPAPELTEVPGEDPAVTFVKHFYNVYNHARRTGDVEAFLGLSSPDCQSCQGMADVISEIYNAGGHIEGAGEFQIVDEPVFFDDPGHPSILVALRQPPFIIIPGPNSVPEEDTGCELFSNDVDLTREGGQWLIAEITSGGC